MRDDSGFLDRMRRVFGGTDDPMRWSVPFFRFSGIDVRVHIVFLIVVVAQLLGALRPTSLGPAYVALLLAALFVIVLLHEFGHAFACRFVGGEANEILMWPLGGLAYCAPPNVARAHLVTTVGGPAVNVVICLLLTPLLFALTRSWEQALPNPLALGSVVISLQSDYLLLALWLANAMSMMLLAFNLLPMFPLDGGRVLQNILWMRVGYRRAMEIAVTTGIVMAIIVGVAAVVLGQMMAFAIAIFGGMICYIEKRRLQFEGDELGFAGYDFSEGYTSLEAGREAGLDGPNEPSKRKLRRVERERHEAEEVDRILGKVSQSGMHSLTAAEKRVLKRATRRRRDA
jgi:stage IV sporulation protein FB